MVLSTPPTTRAWLGLGANLGNPLSALRAARQALAQPPEITVRASSALYRTAPIGGPSGQPDYLNAVLEIDTTLNPDALLQRCLAIEAANGRTRTTRYGARTLDIDLLLFNDLCRQDAVLTLPHPRLHQRRFVLQPLCDLIPQQRLPGSDRTFRELLTAVGEKQGLLRVAELW
jgi:2-amino-4-hydroxy-6-hydroxymethyldihydropteridine diphosphokinase